MSRVIDQGGRARRTPFDAQMLCDYLHLSALLKFEAVTIKTQSRYPIASTNAASWVSIHKTSQTPSAEGQLTLTSPNGGLCLPIPNRA